MSARRSSARARQSSAAPCCRPDAPSAGRRCRRAGDLQDLREWAPGMLGDGDRGRAERGAGAANERGGVEARKAIPDDLRGGHLRKRVPATTTRAAREPSTVWAQVRRCARKWEVTFGPNSSARASFARLLAIELFGAGCVQCRCNNLGLRAASRRTDSRTAVWAADFPSRAWRGRE